MFACANISLLLTSCADEGPEESWLSDDRYPRTLIIYMAAENSLYSFVSNDFNEISKALPEIDKGTRVVIYIDDKQSTRICVGTKDQPLQQVTTFAQNVCSTDSAGMSQVLKDIINRYHSNNYRLVLWSHASGWVFPNTTDTTARRNSRRNTFGADNGHRTSSDEGVKMPITTLRHVLAQLPHFDYIFFDACFMQCVEVAYELRDLCDYIIASPAEIPGMGAPYHELLPTLCAPSFDADSAITKYFDYYNSSFSYTYNGLEIAAVRTSGMEALAEATRPLVTSLFADSQVPYCDDVQKYRPGTSSIIYPEYYDMRHLFSLRASAEEFARWDSVFQSVVSYRLSNVWFSAIPNGHMEVMKDIPHSGGMSIFVPMEKYITNGWMEDYKKLSWYSAAGLNQTGW
ncbi:MAG: hypothetical protein K6F94_02465 [Bacteroidaceae bacterium]|nr:hypothetical protein [Bacteroidaceae bacterium]